MALVNHLQLININKIFGYVDLKNRKSHLHLFSCYALARPHTVYCDIISSNVSNYRLKLNLVAPQFSVHQKKCTS